MTKSRKFTFILSLFVSVCFAATSITPVLADPPPWAPAHGKRAKHKRHHKHEETTVEVYVMPEPIRGGVCNPSAEGSGTVGLIVGAALGGLAGSKLAEGKAEIGTTVAGIFLGGLIGRELGQKVGGRVNRCTAQAFEHAPDGQQVRWDAPEGNFSYNVTPTRTYTQADGRYCRDYRSQVTENGAPHAAQGTACRQADGNWVVVN